MLEARYTPFYTPFSFSSLRHFDRLFDELSRAPLPTTRRQAFPAINLWEDDKGFRLEAECPGLAMDDLELYVVGNQLTLSGKRKEPAQDKENPVYHRRERPHGAFERVITLPTEINSAEVQASLKHGILSVQLPKAASALPKKIEVRSAS